MICPLCEANSDPYYDNYYICGQCDLRFLDSKFYLSPDEEKERYLLHENNINDVRYQEFVKPLVLEVQKHIPKNALGLDFGAGTGPVLQMLLQKEGYKVELYDPFFHPNEEVLNQQYDFIVSSEVIEHFFNPKKEFQKLKSLLKPNGILSVMTEICQEQTDFKNWYYRRDPAHVVFYTGRTLHWIAESFGFEVTIQLPRVATFKKL